MKQVESNPYGMSAEEYKDFEVWMKEELTKIFYPSKAGRLRPMDPESMHHLGQWAHKRDRDMMYSIPPARFEFPQLLLNQYTIDPPHTPQDIADDAKVLENIVYGKMWLDNKEQYIGAFWYDVRYYIPGLLKRISSKYNGCNAYPPSRPL